MVGIVCCVCLECDDGDDVCGVFDVVCVFVFEDEDGYYARLASAVARASASAVLWCVGGDLWWMDV